MIFFTFYTGLFVPARFAAATYGPFIFVKPAYKDDVGLKNHEMTHVKQFWHNPLFGLWYMFSKKSRMEYEAEAYKVQLKFYPDDRLDVFAGLLAKNYNLGITVDQAKDAIVNAQSI